MRCAVIGLGEAGRIYAAALRHQGHDVIGYDPVAPIDDIPRANSIATAVEQADAVIVMTPARVAASAAREAAPHLRQGAVYADFTSSGPVAKRALETELPPTAHAVDVAILGPVIALGTSTPLMAAGPGASVIHDLLVPLGAQVEVVADGRLGDAMAHKMLRSILMKGLAAIVCEAVEAGREAGYEDWIRQQIANELAGDGDATIDRFLTNSAKHAVRRAEEMAAVVEYCHSLGTPADMASGARQSLLRLTERTSEHA